MGVWVCHLQELLKFERLHGHCNVPQKYSQNPSLGAWVAQQRRRYKHGTLSPKRIMLMEQAGIEWALRRGPPPLPSYLLPPPSAQLPPLVPSSLLRLRCGSTVVPRDGCACLKLRGRGVGKHMWCNVSRTREV
jgi:hypothetical protein